MSRCPASGWAERLRPPAVAAMPLRLGRCRPRDKSQRRSWYAHLDGEADLRVKWGNDMGKTERAGPARQDRREWK
jgi:hypothetical protein